MFQFLPPGDFQTPPAACCIFTRPTQYLLALHIRGLEFKEANFRNFRGSVHTIALDVGNVGQCTLPKDRNQ